MSIALGMPTLRRRLDTPPQRTGGGLVDRSGRVATDLRVSLTDRCNLRCTYCMPAQGLPHLPPPKVADRAELLRMIRLAVGRLGITQVRLTGGEPLLRADLTDIVADIAALHPRPEISLTTNGIGLAERATALRQAGLDRVNVSLDSLDPATASAISRRPLLQRTLDGIEAARSAGFAQVKVNAVLLRGSPTVPGNLHEAPALVRWAVQRDLQLRFIEQMPLDADHGWSRAHMVTARDIMNELQPHLQLRPANVARDSTPAELFDVLEHGRQIGRIGIIGSVTRPFCGACARTRLTADGRVRSCLFGDDEIDLLGPLRAGVSDAELDRLWRLAQWNKPAGHRIDQPGFAQPERPMSAIGG